MRCRICNKKCNSNGILSYHLKVSHNIKLKEYIKKNINDFPNWKFCVICGKEITTYDTCSRECYSVNMSNKMKARGPIGPMLQKTKEKLSESAKKRLSVKENHPMFGKRHSEKTITKISCTRKKQGNFWRGKHHTEETKAKLRLVDHSGEKNGMFGKTHTPEAIKKILSHRPMNKFEKKVADILKDLGLKYYFQYFINEDGVCKSYDFKIKHRPFIIECDGDFWHGNPDYDYHWKDSESVQENDKLKDKIAKKRKLNVIRIWESEIKSDPSIFINRLKQNKVIKG